MVTERRWSLMDALCSRVFIGGAVAAASVVLAMSLGRAVVKSLDDFVIGPGSRRLREMTVPLREWVEEEHERTGSFPPALLSEHAAILDSTPYDWWYSGSHSGMLFIGGPGAWPDPLYDYSWQLHDGWRWRRDGRYDMDVDSFLIERGYTD